MPSDIETEQSHITIYLYFEKGITNMIKEIALETAIMALEDMQISLRMVARGKHTHNDIRLAGVARDLRVLADRLEPRIEEFKDG